MTHPLTNALAMRTAAVFARWEDHVADNSPKYLTDWQRGLVAGQQAMRAAILALPLEADHAALVAEAVKLPEIAQAKTALHEADLMLDDGGFRNTRIHKIVKAALSALETP